MITDPESSENSLNLLLVSKLCKAEARAEQEMSPFKTSMILQKHSHSTLSPKFFHSFGIENTAIFGGGGVRPMLYLKEVIRELPWFS